MGEHPGSWYNALEALLPEGVKGYINVMTFASWTVMLVLVVMVILGTRRLTAVPRGWQNLWEWVYEVFTSFSKSVIGESGPKYLPLLATLFIYILLMNLLGVIPGLLSPTTSLNTTMALAAVVFVAVQYYGLRANGIAYLKHFLGDPLWLAPLMLPLHLIGELAKPLSLSVRLFGNIFGEDKTVEAFAGLADQIFKAIHVPLPIQLPMVAFAIFGGFIQAFVFTTLTAAYIGMATAHEEHPDHAGETEKHEAALA
jgi:F-type H+-transporting ATPase subunit a